MSTIKVNVKWGKKKFDNIEVNTSEPPSVFKTQLFSLSGVLPERQKIMVKGGMLKDDADWKALGIKDGHTFMLMGSAESDIVKEPVERPVFVEDMNTDEAAALETAMYPAGLTNLGNTCYMNATVQCLKSIPELNVALKQFGGKNREGDNHNKLTAEMRDLFVTLNNTNQPFPPTHFLQIMRTAFPQFAQTGQHGPMQQDAEECYTQLLLSVSNKLPKFGNQDDKTVNLNNSAIGQLFSGELSSVVKNTEASEEESDVKTESFHKLSCHISSTTNYLLDGLKASLEEQISKRSEKLGRESIYSKQSKISKLPYYLTIQFVRFFWKQDVQVKAKIARPVEFPFTLDLFDLCTDDLKQQLSSNRKLLLDYEDRKLQEYAKELKENKGKKEEKVKNSKKEKPVLPSNVDPSTLKNETGQYELYAVLTHKGRNADSGHYVAWVKEDEDSWLKYDDDVVSQVNNEEIKKLSGKGGSDWHTAYLAFYRTKKLPADLMVTESTTTTTTTTTVTDK